MMRRDGDSWLISDVYLDGAISEVATRRFEFAAILKNQGVEDTSRSPALWAGNETFSRPNGDRRHGSIAA